MFIPGTIDVYRKVRIPLKVTRLLLDGSSDYKYVILLG